MVLNLKGFDKDPQFPAADVAPFGAQIIGEVDFQDLGLLGDQCTAQSGTASLTFAAAATDRSIGGAIHTYDHFCARLPWCGPRRFDDGGKANRYLPFL